MPQFLRFMLGFLDFSAQALSKLFGEYLTGVLNFNRQVSPVVRKESFFFCFFFFSSNCLKSSSLCQVRIISFNLVWDSGSSYNYS